MSSFHAESLCAGYGAKRVINGLSFSLEGGSLMGVVGMLIFIPLMSVVYALFKEVVYLKLKKQRIKKVTIDTVEEYTDEEVERMKEIFKAEHAEDRK